MYRYVRPLHRRLSSRHNVLDLELYDQQLNALAANHTFVLVKDLVSQTESIFLSKGIFGQLLMTAIETVSNTLFRHY